MALLIFLAVCFAAVAGSAIDVERIVGGQPTSVERYPMIVQVENFLPFNIWAQRCAGSILTSRYILSAAHCYVGPGYRPQDRRIRAGSSFRSSGGVIRNVAISINHPTFGLNDYDGDIAVLILETPLVFSEVISRAAIIGTGYRVPDHMQVTQIGWGMTDLPGDRSEVLQEVRVWTINNNVCRQRYEAHNPPRVVTENMICAGFLDIGGRGACYGDSGGPVIVSNVVIGVIAWGEGCANKTTPGVNTAVSPYTSWIVETVV